MQLILIGVIVFGVSYIGYGIAKYYRRRKRYFQDLVFLTERLSVDISFSKDYLQSIFIKSMGSYGKELQSSINGYVEYLKNNHDLTDNLLFNKSTLIKDEEKDTVFLFFKSLGRLDASNQISEINNFKDKFIVMRDEAESDNKKFGALSFKLAMLFALLIVILLI